MESRRFLAGCSIATITSLSGCTSGSLGDVAYSGRYSGDELPSAEPIFQAEEGGALRTRRNSRILSEFKVELREQMVAESVAIESMVMVNFSPQRTDTSEIEETATEQQSATQACPECESEAIIQDGDELLCKDCGFVLDEQAIDHGPEWRAFNANERDSKSHVGAPTTQTMHDKGLTTTIDWKNKDAYGNSLSSKKREQMSRLRTWQERVRTKDAGERNLQFALSEMGFCKACTRSGVAQSENTLASVVVHDEIVTGQVNTLWGRLHFHAERVVTCQYWSDSKRVLCAAVSVLGVVHPQRRLGLAFHAGRNTIRLAGVPHVLRF
jgi:hypothetical protein